MAAAASTGRPRVNKATIFFCSNEVKLLNTGQKLKSQFLKVRKLSYFGHTDDSKEIGYRDTERGDPRRTLRITEQEGNFKLFLKKKFTS